MVGERKELLAPTKYNISVCSLDPANIHPSIRASVSHSPELPADTPLADPSDSHVASIPPASDAAIEEGTGDTEVMWPWMGRDWWLPNFHSCFPSLFRSFSFVYCTCNHVLSHIITRAQRSQNPCGMHCQLFVLSKSLLDALSLSLSPPSMKYRTLWRFKWCHRNPAAMLPQPPFSHLPLLLQHSRLPKRGHHRPFLLKPIHPTTKMPMKLCLLRPYLHHRMCGMISHCTCLRD